MSFPRRHHFKKRHPDHSGRNPNHPGRNAEHFGRHSEPPGSHTDPHELIQPEHTGSESNYLKSLIDSHAKVTVLLTDGEKLHGRIRYYDRFCFSLGPSSNGPKIFIRKTSVVYIAEDQET